MKISFTFYKIAGIILILFSIIGYFTVADEFRHTGEFIGVTSVLIAGIIFMFVDSKFPILKHLSLQWLAIFILLSIPLGGVLLDNMILGISIGTVIGILFSFIIGKRASKK